MAVGVFNVRPRLSAWITSALLAAAATFGACADSPNPVTPPPNPSTGTLLKIEASIRGYVLDSAFRPLAGVAVELTDRAQTWDVATTDFEGRFEFPRGSFTTDLTLRATKPGYLPATNAINLTTFTCCEGRVSTSLTLAPLQNVSLLPGPYTVTFDASDRACSFIPEELRVQSFNATLSLWPYGPESYVLTVDDGRFNQYLRWFRLGVAGGDFGLAEDGWLYWQPSSFERFELGVDPVAVPNGTNTSTLRVPAHSYYCEFNSPNVPTNCSVTPAAQVVRRGSCPTPLTLSPR